MEEGQLLTMRDEFKDPEAARLFAEWILETVAKMPEGSIAALERRIKSLGFHAYMHPSSQTPVLESWYNGPIQVGMKFVWRPGTETEEIVRVTRIATEHHEHDPLIFTDTIQGPSKAKAGIFNDESHFRGSAVPLKDQAK
jgi:hypothetical protein